MAYEFYDDASVDKISFSDIRKIDSLDKGLDYKKIVSFVEEDLHYYGARFDNIDYESAKVLLNYAKENDMTMYSNPARRLFFLNRLPNEIGRKLFEESGYGQDLRFLVSNLDYESYRGMLQGYRDLIPFSDEEIHAARRSYIESVLSSDDAYFSLLGDMVGIVSSSYYFTDDGKLLTDLSEAYDSKRTVAKNAFRDLFCEYMFDDRFKNVVGEIESLYSYARENGFDEDLEMIESLFNVCYGANCGPLSLMFLFEEVKDSDVKKVLDALNEKYRSKTNSSLVDSCSKFAKESSCYDKIKSELNGCDTYYLDGEDFFAFVRSDVQVDKNNISPDEVNVDRFGHSFTCIGKKNIQTYKHPNKVLTMIYDGVTEDNIGHVYHEDSFSTSCGSNTISEYYSADTLLEKTSTYPEVWMKNFTGIKPTAILCLDEATDWDYDVARRNGLDVVILNTNKYERKHGEASMGKQRI